MLAAFPAAASDWVVSKVTGEAWIASSEAPAIRASAGMTIPDGATFSMGRNARAKLEHGAEVILVSPGTSLSPRGSGFFGTMTILQQLGRIELDVEKRNVRHFAVETPFLAAVVKGTHFSVSVSARRADVEVSRGSVEVSDLRSGEVADVAPGQKATVRGAGNVGLQVSGIGALPSIQAGPARSPQVEVPVIGEGSARAGNGSASANARTEQSTTVDGAPSGNAGGSLSGGLSGGVSGGLGGGLSGLGGGLGGGGLGNSSPGGNQK
jgi:hypothetical protein